MIDNIARILRDTLQLDEGVELSASTPLLGAVPELDSMAVVTILTMIEEELGVEIDDASVSADIFESVGSLASFVESRA